MPKRKTTKTSAFGSPGRAGHDSTAFYAGKLYDGQSQGQAVEYTENPIPADALNRIFSHSAENMRELPDGSVHLMVSSPPYNVGKEYDDDLSLEDYLAFLGRVWQETWRVLVPGGRMCINVANLGRKPYIPLHAFIAQQAIQLGFLMRGEIIWNKAASASVSTAWGSWQSAANPVLRDTHGREYLDANSSIWTNLHGHNHPRINAAAKKAIEEFGTGTHGVRFLPGRPASMSSLRKRSLPLKKPRRPLP